MVGDVVSRPTGVIAARRNGGGPGALEEGGRNSLSTNGAHGLAHDEGGGGGRGNRRGFTWNGCRVQEALVVSLEIGGLPAIS